MYGLLSRGELHLLNTCLPHPICLDRPLVGRSPRKDLQMEGPSSSESPTYDSAHDAIELAQLHKELHETREELRETREERDMLKWAVEVFPT
jgi:hypothetical protein